jgi:leucyl-tRNA synthetase
MKRYNPSEIEPKWQKIWQETEAFKAEDFADQPKTYIAEMLPYPSAAGLHVGHVRNFTIVDVLARFHKQLGENVMRPFGFDEFGLPTENYAIKVGKSPQQATMESVANFRNQAEKLGFAIDWSRKINTSDPEYYRWTQWIFTRLFEKGLAYKAENYQWWCPVDQTVLANEQVENGHCWRCGNEVEKKKMSQWFFKITAYADELLDEIDGLDWPEKIKTMQRNWIGRSEGAEIEFPIAGTVPAKIKVFTTRPDTIFGATFLVLAPEHQLVTKITTDGQRQLVIKYINETLKKTEIERQENKQKTGVFTGSYAINPASGEKIPIWIADYVLATYGEGAIMAVPAHDTRDNEFAQKFDLPIVEVIEKPSGDEVYTGEGLVVNSDKFNGHPSSEAREEIVKWLESEKIGKRKVTYRMRDWLISRQRYWGCPIPIAYDKNGQAHIIPEDQLPVLLPEMTDYRPDKSGHSALAKNKDFLKVTINGEEMMRETDTLDGYACSSWYLLRYCDPHNDEAAWDKEKVDYWNPLDIYVGADHAVAHLLYVRFWTKFFADEGLINFREPVKKLLYNGYINASDGKKMSKSKGNVIDPLEIIEQGYGADTLRTYEMFIGPYDQDAVWDTRAIGGVYRFLTRVWQLAQNFLEKPNDDDGSTVMRHKTIKKVTEDIRRNNFNTAVSALMEYVNDLYKGNPCKDDITTLAKLLSPFAPHMAAEILEQFGSDDKWPAWDEKYLITDEMTIAVQVNGKLRGEVKAAWEASEEDVKNAALQLENVKVFMGDKKPARIIYVPGRIVNIVLS